MTRESKSPGDSQSKRWKGIFAQLCPDRFQMLSTHLFARVPRSLKQFASSQVEFKPTLKIVPMWVRGPRIGVVLMNPPYFSVRADGDLDQLPGCPIGNNRILEVNHSDLFGEKTMKIVAILE
jgi:hypothetical protein